MTFTSIHDARIKSLQEYLDISKLDALLLYSSRADSRYTKWISGSTCRSTHHYFIVEKNKSYFLEVTYRAEELRQRTGLKVLTIPEEDCYDKELENILSDHNRIGYVGLAPMAHLKNINSEFVDCTNFVSSIMLSKSEEEVVAIRNLAKDLEKYIKLVLDDSLESDFMTEEDLANKLKSHLSQISDSLAFPCTLISNDRLKLGTVGAPTNKVITSENNLLIDAGIVRDGLYADLTRMRFATKLGLYECYSNIIEAINESLNSIFSGMKSKDLVGVITSKLSQKKLPIHNLTIQDFGHGIGYTLHEQPFLGMENSDEIVLPDNTILCIEPEFLIEDTYIRYENMICVGKNGSSLIIS